MAKDLEKPKMTFWTRFVYAIPIVAVIQTLSLFLFLFGLGAATFALYFIWLPAIILLYLIDSVVDLSVLENSDTSIVVLFVIFSFMFSVVVYSLIISGAIELVKRLNKKYA